MLIGCDFTGLRRVVSFQKVAYFYSSNFLTCLLPDEFISVADEQRMGDK